MKKELCFLFLIFIFSSVRSFSQINPLNMSATQALHAIHLEYMERFDSAGNYINNPALTKKFYKSQIQTISLLKKNNLIGKSFQIKNSAMSDIIISVSIVHDKNNDLAGLLIERNKYDHFESESMLRLFSLPILSGGMIILTFNGETVLHISSKKIDSKNGGQVILKYPSDFKKNEFKSFSFELSRNNDEFLFKTSKGSEFQSIYINLWYNLLSQNFGLNSLTFEQNPP